MQSTYFGGSRHQSAINPAQIAQVVAAVVATGSRVHVGCQYGADQAVVKHAPANALHVFCVAATAPAHVAQKVGAQVTLAAGGTVAPIQARYLLRSVAAFTGCSAAVFFAPGAGSLAVAREAVKAGLPIYAFTPVAPAPIPSTPGAWASSSFAGFACWQWSAPQQISLF